LSNAIAVNCAINKLGATFSTLPYSASKPPP
jgi:hypothetical protein